MWLDKELRWQHGKVSDLFKQGLTVLAEKGKANIYEFTDSVQRVIPLMKKLYTLESMGIIKINEDSGEISITSPRARRILTIALIEESIGHELRGLRIYKGSREALITTLIEVLRKG